MKVVSYPQQLQGQLLALYGRLLESGQVAEGPYYREEGFSYVKDKQAVPVVSGGSALFSVLAYYKHAQGRRRVIVQDNTMRALYAVPRLLEMEVQICAASALPGFMAMDPGALEQALEQARRAGELERAVVLYSVIGGYLAPAYDQVEALAQHFAVPLVVDMAHGHYLERLERSQWADLAYSFYATKILPAGEGGLVATADAEKVAWIRRFLSYDRFEYGLECGLNLRASEFTAAFIHLLMSDAGLKGHFRDDRAAIAERYRQVCLEHGIAFLDPHQAQAYNGYKFVVFDPWEAVAAKGTLLTRHGRTSPVFGAHVRTGEKLLDHWCPPTYASLKAEISGVC